MEQTQHLPRTTVEDLYAADRPCPICAEVDLSVTHLQDLPDYIKCGSCGSVFVLDSGSDRVMFGAISPDYPQTSRFALKRWQTVEAVRAAAAEERAPALDSSQDEPAPPFGAAAAAALDANQSLPVGQPEAAPTAHAPAVDQPAAQPFEHFEPEPGQRYRVIVLDEPAFPSDRCAHCYRAPAPRRIPASGELDPPRSFEIPLCKVCFGRATTQSGEEGNARLIAHLSSVLVGAALFVLTLALSRLGAQLPMFLSIGLGTILGALGYGTAALVTLSRLPQYPPTEDALYVLSTALIQYRKMEDGLAFSWRNPRYAERFLAANQAQAVGEVTKVFESGRINRPAVTNR